MATERIVFVGASANESAERRLTDHLDHWRAKWFGGASTFEVSIRVGTKLEAPKLRDLGQDDDAAQAVGAAAVGFGAGPEELGESRILTELGQEIIRDFVTACEQLEESSSPELRGSPYEEAKEIEVCVDVAGAAVRCAVPRAVYLQCALENEQGGDSADIAGLSLSDIRGKVRLNVELQGTALRVEELFALDVGDVLALEHPLDEPAKVRLEEGRLVLHAYLGKQGTHKAMLVNSAGD